MLQRKIAPSSITVARILKDGHDKSRPYAAMRHTVSRLTGCPPLSHPRRPA